VSVLLVVVENKFLQFSMLFSGTLIFLILIAMYGGWRNIIFNYFLLQEYLGLHYVLRVSSFIIFLVLIIKGGISPFLFWVFIMVDSLDGLLFSIFVSFQKVYPLSLVLFLQGIIEKIFLLLRVFVVLLLYWINYSYKFLFVLSRGESLSWSVLFLQRNIERWFLLLLYFYLIYTLRIRLRDINFLLRFMSFPWSLVFILKFFRIFNLFYHFVVLYCLMVLVSLSVCGTSLIFILFFMKNSGKINFSGFLIILFPFLLVLTYVL